MSELKPCPFCGSSDVSRSWKRATRIAIECMNCEANGPVLKGESMQEAKDNAHATWNTRVSPWRSLRYAPPTFEDWKPVLLRDTECRHVRDEARDTIVTHAVSYYLIRSDRAEEKLRDGFTEWMEVPS